MLAAAALQNPFLALLGLAVIVLAILVVITYIIRVAALVVLAAAAPLLLIGTPSADRAIRQSVVASHAALLVAPVAQSLLLAVAFRVLLTSDGVLGLPIGSGFIDILVVGTSCTSCSRSRSGCCTRPSPVPRRERSRRRSGSGAP